MTDRIAQALADIDGVNAHDPVVAERDGETMPRALLYGRRMSDRLDRYRPEASDELRIAARAQHIERWVKPRDTYPQGRIGYLSWRKDLQKHHADRAGQLMQTRGYEQSAIDRVGSLLRKERLKQDDEVQALEDVICLVFLEFEASGFVALHDDEKVRDILAKTARKMSARGLAEAGRLQLDARLAKLLGEALAGKA